MFKGNLMSVKDVLNALSLAASLAYFLIPTIVLLFTISLARTLVKSRTQRKSQRSTGTKRKSEQVEIYSSLVLEFDKKGRVKK